MSKVVNIDFDGTIVDFKFPKIGKPLKGAKEALKRLKKMGFYIRIFSCRTSSEVVKYPIERLEQVRQMKTALKKYGIPFDEVLEIDKPLGYFIDDKNVAFNGDWDKSIKDLEEMSKDE